MEQYTISKEVHGYTVRSDAERSYAPVQIWAYSTLPEALVGLRQLYTPKVEKAKVVKGA